MPSYQRSLGPLTAEDDRLRGPKPIVPFDFIACSGARTWHIHGKGAGATSGGGDGQPKESQASLLKDTNPDLVTLSIGGNNVGFFELFDQVYFTEDLWEQLMINLVCIWVLQVWMSKLRYFLWKDRRLLKKLRESNGAAPNEHRQRRLQDQLYYRNRLHLQ